MPIRIKKRRVSRKTTIKRTISTLLRLPAVIRGTTGGKRRGGGIVPSFRDTMPDNQLFENHLADFLAAQPSQGGRGQSPFFSLPFLGNQSGEGRLPGIVPGSFSVTPDRRPVAFRESSAQISRQLIRWWGK